MLTKFVKNPKALEALTKDRQVSNYRVWHVWTVTLPRRSITGRLVWGTVWRRYDNGRWIYKKYVESVDVVQRWRAVRALVAKASDRPRSS
jgi:hypothetical protein